MHDFRDPAAKRRATMERWAIFLLGVSIGCVLLGIYFSGKQGAVERQQQQQQPPGTQPESRP